MYEESSHVANDGVGSIQTVASFSAEDEVMSLYNEKCSTPLKSGNRQVIISGIGTGIGNSIFFSVYAFIFWVGARMVQHGETTFSNVFMVNTL